MVTETNTLAGLTALEPHTGPGVCWSPGVAMVHQPVAWQVVYVQAWQRAQGELRRQAQLDLARRYLREVAASN